MMVTLACALFLDGCAAGSVPTLGLESGTTSATWESIRGGFGGDKSVSGNIPKRMLNIGGFM